MDIVLTTDNPYVVKSVFHGFPITYEKKKTKEQKISDAAVANLDTKSFDSPIGGITNLASNFIAMQSNFKEGSPEYNELKRRTDLLRFYQGSAIS